MYFHHSKGPGLSVWLSEDILDCSNDLHHEEMVTDALREKVLEETYAFVMESMSTAVPFFFVQ